MVAVKVTDKKPMPEAARAEGWSSNQASQKTKTNQEHLQAWLSSASSLPKLLQASRADSKLAIHCLAASACLTALTTEAEKAGEG